MGEETVSMATRRAIPAALIFSMVLIALITTGEAAAAVTESSCTGKCKSVCGTFGDVDVKECDGACDRICSGRRTTSAMSGDDDAPISLPELIGRIIRNWPSR